MMVKFTHYLVTRFNIKIDGFGPEYFRPDDRSPTWETDRMPLFETYCAPSVAGQVNRNFKWLLYCDPQTDENILHRISIAVKNVSSFEIIFVEDFKAMLIHLQQTLSQSITPFVITSRLDNDDGIGINYVDDIQANFIPQDNIVLNLLSGVYYNDTQGVFTYHRFNQKNSFTSLIEEKKSPDLMVTIMGFRHLYPPNNLVIRNIKTKCSFWMTLHDQNEAIRGGTGWPILPSSISKYYTINLSHLRISIPKTILYTFRWLPYALYRKIKYKSLRVLQHFIKTA